MYSMTCEKCDIWWFSPHQLLRFPSVCFAPPRPWKVGLLAGSFDVVPLCPGDLPRGDWETSGGRHWVVLVVALQDCGGLNKLGWQEHCQRWFVCDMGIPLFTIVMQPRNTTFLLWWTLLASCSRLAVAPQWPCSISTCVDCIDRPKSSSTLHATAQSRWGRVRWWQGAVILNAWTPGEILECWSTPQDSQCRLCSPAYGVKTTSCLALGSIWWTLR